MNNEEKILQMLGEMRTEQAGMRAELAEMRSGLAEMRSGLAEMKAEQAEMRDLLQKVAVTQEAVVLPRLDLLAEGHAHLADTLAPKSRVEALEDDVSFMKTVIKALSQEVAELKKAQ